LVALAMALGASAHEDQTISASPWDDPAFTLAS
jgi:hypothetical protein